MTEKKKDELPTIEINGLEIFSVGKWNSDEYTLGDLQQIVNAFGEVGFEPTVKAGHENAQENPATSRRLFGEPALGYVKRIYIEGKKLLADLYQVPKRFGELIKAGTYKRVSAEIYWDYLDEFKKKKWPRVLKSIAFLGADIPALPNLKAIEALFTLHDGQLSAYDENRQEYRIYDQPISEEKPLEYCGMDLMPSTVRKMAKADVNYAESGGGDASCGACRFFQGGGCSIVEGTIDYDGTCDLQKPYPTMQMSKADAQNELKTYIIRKRGDQWCVLTEDGSKTLGCHDTEAEAKAQLRAVEANKDKNKYDKEPDVKDVKVTSKGGGKAMDEKEVQEKFEAMWTEKEEKLRLDIRRDVEKEYDYKVQRAREDGKAEVLKEKAELEADIRKLQADKRSERIEHWIKTMKSEGKILPVEEPKIRTMREWITDDGPTLKFFALKNGKPEAQEMSPADLFESLFSSRAAQLYKTMSKDDAPDEDDGKELSDPGAEVDRRAKRHIAQQQEKNNKVTYKDATAWVLSKDGALSQRYNQGRALN